MRGILRTKRLTWRGGASLPNVLLSTELTGWLLYSSTPDLHYIELLIQLHPKRRIWKTQCRGNLFQRDIMRCAIARQAQAWIQQKTDFARLQAREHDRWDLL